MTRTEKRCPVCTLTKPAAAFPKNRSRYDGLGTRCTACHVATYGARHRDAKREMLRRVRREAEAVYGGKCVHCGSTANLQFDHVHGGGGEHREWEKVQAMYRRIARTGRLSDVELQLLCRPCHWVKTRANGETRGKAAV